MYVLVKRLEGRDFFYQVFSDETDLYAVYGDTLETCRKYSEEEKRRISDSGLLKNSDVQFKKLGFIIL